MLRCSTVFYLLLSFLWTSPDLLILWSDSPFGLITFDTRHFGYENSGYFLFFFYFFLLGGGFDSMVVVLVHRRAWRRDIPFLCAREITDFMFFKWRRGAVGWFPCLEPAQPSH